jgi:hypothetical protein
MPKAEKVLSLFPAIYRAREAQTLMAMVVRALAAPLEEADAQLFRVQRAHRLNVAEHPKDIVRLAAALNLNAFHFEDLLVLPYAEVETALALMRGRIKRVARIHLGGLGTPWAVLEGAAVFLNADIVAEAAGGPLLRRLDSEGYSHEATIVFGAATDTPRDRVILHENPLRRRRVEVAERYTGEQLRVENRTADAVPLALAIRGVGERTVRPSLYCPANQQGVMFDGVVPDGSVLILDERGEARLDGAVVSQWVITYVGGAYDGAIFDQARTVVEHGGGVRPFDIREAPPPYQANALAPKAPKGPSDWIFRVAEARWDGGDWDFAVFAMPEDPSGLYDKDFNFDQASFAVAPNGAVGLAWNERIPCSFKLLLPKDTPAVKGAKGQVNYGGRVAAVTPRFRAAGVRAYVEAAPDTWRLGESVLRSADAANGEGVDRRPALVRGPLFEMFASIEDDAPGAPEPAHG